MVNQYCKHTLGDKGNAFYTYFGLYIFMHQYFLHDLTCPVTSHTESFIFQKQLMIEDSAKRHFNYKYKP